MRISSDDFENEGVIPAEYTCDGSDLSPSLVISDVPGETKSLALVMDDPDAPMGTFTHWVVWNIPPGTARNESGEDISYPQGRTSFGTMSYGGPCPPGGTHRYFFKLYALDTLLDLLTGSSKADLEKAMKGHVVSKALLVGKYSRN